MQTECISSDIIVCPYCNSKSIVKAGIRKLKKEAIQRFRCNSCLKYFTNRKLKQKTYPANMILNTISTYNLGNTLKQTKKEVAKRYRTQIPESTIHSWIKQYKEICTFSRLREQAIKIFSNNINDIIFSQNLNHKQIYKFQLHKAKLELTANELEPQKFTLLKTYLQKIPTKQFPHHIFQPKQEEEKEEELEELSRSSQMKFETLKFIKIEKHNSANKLAQLSLTIANTNKQRHEAIQNFFLINDSTTIATEIPVYLTNDDVLYFKSKGFTFNFKNYKTPITGHIDILQIRNGLIHILDYKPEANKQNPIAQLTIYALALASRTKLAIKDFKCAWFDEDHYFEFFPLHAVYSKH